MSCPAKVSCGSADRAGTGADPDLVAALACGDAMVVVHLRVPGAGTLSSSRPGAVHVDDQLCAGPRGCGRE